MEAVIHLVDGACRKVEITLGRRRAKRIVLRRFGCFSRIIVSVGVQRSARKERQVRR